VTLTYGGRSRRTKGRVNWAEKAQADSRGFIAPEGRTEKSWLEVAKDGREKVFEENRRGGNEGPL